MQSSHQTDRIKPDPSTGFAVRELDDDFCVIARRNKIQCLLIEAVGVVPAVDRLLDRIQGRAVIEQDLRPANSRSGNGTAFHPE